MSENPKPSRKEQILQILAQELESNPGTRITTAALAAAVGVSEAALYRHFASKAKMFEALIDFAEDSVFTLANKIMEQEQDVLLRCERLMLLVLGFSERNPGITRVLLGDALVGENERLRKRVAKFFERIESQIKQILREANLSDGPRAIIPIDAGANQIVALIEGRMIQYVRSNFEKKPTDFSKEQWQVIQAGLFKTFG